MSLRAVISPLVIVMIVLVAARDRGAEQVEARCQRAAALDPICSAAAVRDPAQADRAKARRLLLEAKKRGAPADVDDLLRALDTPNSR